MNTEHAKTAARALRAAFKQVWGRYPSDNELIILAAHGFLESGWGRGRYRSYPEGLERGALPSPPKPPAHGTYYSPIINNWGAVTVSESYAKANPDKAWGPAADSDSRGIYKTYMRRYASPAEGAAHFVRVATTGGMSPRRQVVTMPALARGSVEEYVDAQLKTVYFKEAAGSSRAQKIAAIKKFAKQFADANGIKITPPSSIPLLLVAAVAGVGGYYAYKKWVA